VGSTSQNQILASSSIGARMFWYLECWGLKRIDAWGVTFIMSALALVIHHAITVQSSILLIAITADYWWAYWLNDYFDAKYDSEDEVKAHQTFFVHRPGARQLVTVVSVLVFGLSTPVFLSFGWSGAIVLLITFFIMWAYSAPPLRLKSRPGLDLLTHALFVQTWPYIICIWLTLSAWTELDGILLGIFFLTSLNGQLNQQIRDFDVDSRTDTNFATRLGLPKTMFILKVSTSVVVVLALFALKEGSIPWLFAPLGVLGLPKIVYQMLHRLDRSQRSFPRWLVYILTLLALIYTGVLMAWDWTI
jgi:4-hydroxybenzoate polyprenyltransferase